MTVTTTRKSVTFTQQPLVKLVAYLVSWFLYVCSFSLLVYAVVSVGAVGGSCASGNTPYAIAVQCPEDATAFLPWVIFTALIAVGIGVALAPGIGFSLRVWAWPILFGVLGLFFIAAFVLAGAVVGLVIGIMFIVMALVPLIIELRASVQRVFLGSFSIFGQQFYEGAKAQASFSSRKMPNPPDAIRPRFRDWAIALLGFVVPAIGGYMVATAWVNALAA